MLDGLAQILQPLVVLLFVRLLSRSLQLQLEKKISHLYRLRTLKSKDSKSKKSFDSLTILSFKRPKGHVVKEPENDVW